MKNWKNDYDKGEFKIKPFMWNRLVGLPDQNYNHKIRVIANDSITPWSYLTPEECEQQRLQMAYQYEGLQDVED
ncbi:MAG: hypothetical protein OEZ57_00765 [Nitrospirota bacterium]|nr:hypothetical protein [Nitrospira sp.]MCA9479871.1 hypothetical protein [Nitrospira sp.]MDH5457081.1 hypothetical protein [Nitrospinota bacterium]MDH5585172.1 hypothetical protein [Nitrospirota bacterium]MDH5773429.1 hypothetical protein [Nitrospirota bacterium]